MSVTLKQIADMAEDLYYQNYKADDQFFDLAHFKFLLATKYAEIINDEYKANKLLNKTLTGFSWVEISQDWLITESVEIKRDKDEMSAELSQGIFGFEFDALSSGVQFVNIGGQCGELVRISINDRFAVCRMPITAQIMYYVKGSKIIFVNMNCDVKEAEVMYIPSVDCTNDDALLSDYKVHPMITETLNLMFGSKNGNIVDMTDDSNPNTSPATELDTHALK